MTRVAFEATRQSLAGFPLSTARKAVNLRAEWRLTMRVVKLLAIKGSGPEIAAVRAPLAFVRGEPS
jgi:hypothetical protein